MVVANMVLGLTVLIIMCCCLIEISQIRNSTRVQMLVTLCIVVGHLMICGLMVIQLLEACRLIRAPMWLAIL